MLFDRYRAVVSWVRRIPAQWQRVGLIVSGLLLCELGARLPIFGLNSEALREFLRRESGGGLLGLYDFLAGGAMSRGAVLGLGILPYLSARIMMRLARTAIPSLERQLEGRAGVAKATRWTRVLTTGLALIQSYGFARFSQSVPGAVANPGIGYVVPTVLLLTGGAVLMMLISEKILGQSVDEASSDIQAQSRELSGSPDAVTIGVPPVRERLLNASTQGLTDLATPVRTPIPVPLRVDRTND